MRSTGKIVPIDPLLVPCTPFVTLSDLQGGAPPGTSYDGVVSSGDLLFSERFVGQSLSSNGSYDVVSGLPSSPLQAQVGEAGQNLDVFDYSGNVLTGLGPSAFPDVDAIGEGSIAIRFPGVHSKVRLSLVGGNGGTATLTFYRLNGSLVGQIVVADLGDLAFGFGTLDGSYSIAGILIQNNDPSGIGVNDLCYDSAPVSTQPLTWGRLKQHYR